jgi:ubiquinone/menaquinone biosynthesis C-methylase UbiE
MSSSPSIAFNPALVLQRQAFLLETLRNVKPKSVLDVGCGEGRLLDCLVRCDEALPVELLAGIDISLRMLEQASRSIESTAEDQQVDGRWRSLDVVLLRGYSFCERFDD